ncbi:MAG: glycosyltransferase family 2 protein [Gammaproteobacteria bacterium]|nr:glycosyltransferase family 2 protein [Gammaproteobacteria bacterium]
MEKLSVFIITYNCAKTLRPCLESVKWADEIVALDSASNDGTLELLEEYGAHVHQTPFLGYGPTKQLAIDKTRNNWVMHVDADEMLSPELEDEIRALLAAGPDADGYLIPRLDQLFWEMNSPHARLNSQLKLFDKRRGRMNDMAVHSDPEVDGKVRKLEHVFYHFSEVDIHTKVAKINGYSTGLVADKLAKRQRASPWKLVFYPPLVFLQQFFIQRNFLNGWAGFIGSSIGAFYAFLRYAKLYEHHRFADPSWKSELPPGAPIVRVTRDEAGRVVDDQPKERDEATL